VVVVVIGNIGIIVKCLIAVAGYVEFVWLPWSQLKINYSYTYAQIRGDEMAPGPAGI
jgi:hypothetical protein